MMAKVLALVLLLLTAAPHPEAAARPRRSPTTWIASPGIQLSDELREAISAVAAAYYKRTKRRLEITSGVRPPARQAAAMYAKLAAGGSLAIYRNQSLIEPVRKAYRDGRKKRWKKDRIIAAMTQVLEDQAARGHFISRHMRGRAFDVRSTGLTGKQRQAFLAAVREVGGMRVIHESKPPHFHVEIIGPRDRDEGDGERTDAEDEDQLRPEPNAPPEPQPTPEPRPEHAPMPGPDPRPATP